MRQEKNVEKNRKKEKKKRLKFLLAPGFRAREVWVGVLQIVVCYIPRVCIVLHEVRTVRCKTVSERKLI